jgi:hypothetical protein
MGIFLFFVERTLPVSLISIWALVILGGSAYLFVIYLLVGSSIVADIKKVLANLFNRA